MKTLAVCSLVIAAALPVAAVPLARGAALPVRILFDNSGSMYPGYLPPGTPDRQTRQQLGVHYVYQSPAFVRWLDDFVQRQSVMGGTTAGMWTFTSNDRFTPADVLPVHPEVSLRDFRAANAIAHFPPRTGNSTYLTESLNAFSRDFTGVVWLITDNIVEANAGEPDTGVQEFFRSLARQQEYRSVHLFKYTLEENGHTATLAVYGILVSAAPVPNETLALYDRRFRELLPGREHLKLKNLSIEPMVLSADLQLVVEDREKGTFAEGDNVQLALDGEIKSYLTQHSVTAGRYELAIGEPFVAEDWAQHDIGAQPIPSEAFDSVSGSIDQPIPPNGTRRVEALLHSQQRVSFTSKGLSEWVRLAWNGASVRYSGAVRMSMTDIRVKFERQRMAGIFGIDHAAQIFEVQDVATIPNVQPSLAPVSFVLHTGPRRTAVLLTILAVLAVLAGLGGFLLSRKQIFRVRITGTPEWLLALRRLGRGNVMHEGKLLGRLSRGMFATYAFHPVPATSELTVVPANDGEWDVRLPGGTRRMTIKTEGGAQKAPAKANAPAARAAPAPPPSPSSKPPLPPGRPLRPGRP